MRGRNPKGREVGEWESRWVGGKESGPGCQISADCLISQPFIPKLLVQNSSSSARNLSTWRLLPVLDAPGRVQMAIDQWLLDQHRHCGHPPTLRFYTWNPAAISLGVSQRRKFPAHWRHLSWQGKPVDLVSRPSGGRGVLHQGDLTYAVVASHIPGTLDQVYRTICQFLIEGWKTLGVDLRFGEPDRQYVRSQNCFGLATNADLVDTYGNKFIGSAQLKQGKYFLQHGSMLLRPNPELFHQVFHCAPPKTVDCQAGILSDLSISTIVGALTNAAEQCFQCQFLDHPLTPEEWQGINQIAASSQKLP
jgi:lipoate-protein ligase A